MFAPHNRLRKRTDNSSRLESTAKDVAKETKSSSKSCEAPTIKLTPPKEQSFDTMSPLPTPNQTLRFTNERRKFPPSQSILDRYKGHSPLEVLPTFKTSAPIQISATRAKDTSFGERFGATSLLPTSRPERFHSPSRSDIVGKSPILAQGRRSTVTYQGVEFEMEGPGNPKLSRRGLIAEPPRPGGEDASRQSRAQTRRRERTDSGSSPSTFYSQNTCKDKGTTTVDSSLTHLIPNNSPHTYSASPTSPASRATCDSGVFDSPRTISSAEAIAHLQDGFEDVATSHSPEAKFKKALHISTSVAICPPHLTSTVPTALIWTSQSSVSSRPQTPWGPCKRWTCCSCRMLCSNGAKASAKTIVEQAVCSNIDCGHRRCAKLCKVVSTQS